MTIKSRVKRIVSDIKADMPSRRSKQERRNQDNRKKIMGDRRGASMNREVKSDYWSSGLSEKSNKRMTTNAVKRVGRMKQEMAKKSRRSGKPHPDYTPPNHGKRKN